MDGTMNPSEIYSRSFSYIRSEMGLDRSLKSDIIVRTVHATADFDIGKSLVFSRHFENSLGYIRNGGMVITDINMVYAGIPRHARRKCFINDHDVIENAKNSGLSRSYLAIKKACREYPDGVYIIGDAPTALLSLLESVDDGSCNPELIIGVPVGFVSALESKSKLLSFNGNFITNLSRKGGSAVAAAIFNAMEAYENVY
ncbi:precorrin-8X methylmutase [Ferroplasma sp.]|uniref:precorrin-8X methylmutase n=1 Tax=Ferroplasma sp. TaxID=2591003 RepID=UPI002612522F|nr:precorrin-8X methylmutase [Ferroplasma sp.]MCL4453794.1 precorrin-8X methylmutase [Candidatus Thermoplasmatota archaeon]